MITNYNIKYIPPGVILEDHYVMTRDIAENIGLTHWRSMKDLDDFLKRKFEYLANEALFKYNYNHLVDMSTIFNGGNLFDGLENYLKSKEAILIENNHIAWDGFLGLGSKYGIPSKTGKRIKEKIAKKEMNKLQGPGQGNKGEI
ncbi:hypothetical protein PGT21_003461 [Puccinia graminis f. sp. tritici]|uniref:Uncharacterized protein n=1 Tax=Puccinia graminis f. sp. tritici TaxID=56615 RepID=A0A5B0QHU6_PUCGR|nr:hypothetical protein PGT21_003461 [Puccinia graminis f. sp. tritici]